MEPVEEHKLAVYLKALKGIYMWPFVCKNWFTGILAYLGKIPNKKEITYKLWNGLKLHASGSADDLQVIREVFLHNTYADRAIDFSKIKTVVEAGAHKGYVAMLLAQNSSDDTQIYCFEPEISNVDLLKSNVYHNDFLDKITVDDSAMATYDGTATFYISEYTHGHSLEEGHNDNTSKIDVPCKSIPSILKEYELPNIDLLKMDIEGSEYDILFGLDKEILEGIKYILVEAHDTKEHNMHDMVSFLEKNSFECHIPYIFETTIIAVNKNI